MNMKVDRQKRTDCDGNIIPSKIHEETVWGWVALT